MNIVHIALGGCLKAPPVQFGITRDTGGHIAYVLDAAQAQARRPEVDRVDIITRAFTEPDLDPVHAAETELVGPKLTIHRLASASTAYLENAALIAELPALQSAFLDHLRARPLPDVIHAHFDDAAVLARAASEAFGIPWIYTPHSLGLEKLDCGEARICDALVARTIRERRAIEETNALIVSSRDEAERQITNYVPAAEGKTLCIPPGLTLTPAPSEAAEPPALLADQLDQPDKPMILAVARPVRKKNLGALVAMYGRSPTLQRAANLVILAGQHGEDARIDPEQALVLSELRAAIARHGLQGKVALPPSHTRRDVAALYARAARDGVFVNPALHEPFGLTLLEAAAAGVPLVAGRNGGPLDILGRLQTGQLVDPADPEAIAAACLRALTDPAERDSARKTRHRVAETYDWDLWAARSLETIANLAAPPRVRARRATPPRRVLACDLDGTLTGCAEGARAFRTWRELAGPDLLFVLATGRSLGAARDILRQWALPEPDVFIPSVGSEIWRRDDTGQLRPCRDFACHIGPDWFGDLIDDALGPLNLRPQPVWEQRRFKRGFFGTTAEATRIRDTLSDAGLAAEVIASHGRFIDILPRRAGKGNAILFEAARHGLRAEDCIAAGDSGNDLQMLEMCGTAILPANALPEIAHLDRPGLQRSRAAHAAGVLEGLQGHDLVSPTLAAE
ncbi:HAD family hydrolase [Dinoroseobacter sp. S375]|uniref:HAD family hydrolase n=1 Tax=Dinoroseobacter sp. S375 TaxID=3415136 RepID=UPI003C7CF2F5